MRALPLLALLAGCPAVTPPDRTGPFFFEVTFEGDPGGLDPSAPLPFSAQANPVRVRVQAKDGAKAPLGWSGPVTVHVAPGRFRDGDTVSETARVDLVDGVGVAELGLALGYDQVRLWVSDEGDEGAPGSFAAGAAPLLHVRKPTVAEVQRPINADGDSPLDRMYAPIQGMDGDQPRELIVTSVLNDGFYVTDFSEPDLAFASLFVFTFSRPDGLQPGDRLAGLAGTVDEFVGLTELSFPSWRVESSGHDPGTPRLLDPASICDDLAMEQWESAVVRVEGVRSDFRRRDDCVDYADYGQWPAALDGLCDGATARIGVVNANTVPSFDFPSCLADSPALPDPVALPYVQGILRHTTAADPPWIVEVRGCHDLPESARPADCPQLLRRPPSGPRKAPQHFYRDLVTCEGHPAAHVGP